MTLYHAHSDVLGGFYQSDVFVSAEDDTSALWKAVTATPMIGSARNTPNGGACSNSRPKAAAWTFIDDPDF
jgi:hypothetical protein